MDMAWRHLGSLMAWVRVEGSRSMVVESWAVRLSLVVGLKILFLERVMITREEGVDGMGVVGGRWEEEKSRLGSGVAMLGAGSLWSQ